jgi:hypothetical protein
MNATIFLRRDYWNERLQMDNPIFMKDIRIWMRSPMFLMTFFGGQFLILLTTLAAVWENELLMDVFDGTEGLYNIMYGMLIFSSALLIPMLIFGQFRNELKTRAMELASLTRLTPHEFIRGKVKCALSLSMLFFAAILPSLSISYLMGGIDLTVAILQLVVTIAGTVTVTLMVLLLAAMISTNVLCLLLALGVTVTGTWMTMGTVFVLPEEINRSTNQEEQWLVIGLLVLVAPVVWAFLYQAAAAHLTSPHINRETKPRLALMGVNLAYSVLILILCWINEWRDKEEILLVWIVGSALITFFGILAIPFPRSDDLSRRVKSEMPRWSLISAFISPGFSRLFVFIGLHFLVYILLVIIDPFASSRLGHDDQGAVLSMLCSMFNFYLLGILVYLIARSSSVEWMKKLTPMSSMLIGNVGMLFIALCIYSVTDEGAEVWQLSPISSFGYALEDRDGQVLVNLVTFLGMVGWAVVFARCVAEGAKIRTIRKREALRAKPVMVVDE